MPITGLHHITLGCSNAQHTTNFYCGVLGLRLLKKTVNFDDPNTYHLYFGNYKAEPGSVITFFEWPNASKGRQGIGGTHHFALSVSNLEVLLKWKRRLLDLGIEVDGPLDRHYFVSIYFRDPDGAIIELATQGPGWTVDEELESIGTEYRAPPPEMMLRNRDEERIRQLSWDDPLDGITDEMRLGTGMHHITAIGTKIQETDVFYRELLGLSRVKMTSNFDDPDSAHWYWGVGGGEPGTLVTYFERDPQSRQRVRMGVGQTHHFALAVPDEGVQMNIRKKLLAAGYPVSPVMERVYFKSIYTRDPDDHIVELATYGPGFGVDEPADKLGIELKLPPWLEGRRPEIEMKLRPLHPVEEVGK